MPDLFKEILPSIVADQEINLVACLTEIMVTCEVK